MGYLDDVFKKIKSEEAASGHTSSGSGPAKPKQVQGVLLVSRKPLTNSQTLLRQIVDSQRSQGYSIAANLAAKMKVTSQWDEQMLQTEIRVELSKFGGANVMKRTAVSPFRTPDGISGKYYVVFDRP
jgi:hypothetical protein